MKNPLSIAMAIRRAKAPVKMNEGGEVKDSLINKLLSRMVSAKFTPGEQEPMSDESESDDFLSSDADTSYQEDAPTKIRSRLAKIMGR